MNGRRLSTQRQSSVKPFSYIVWREKQATKILRNTFISIQVRTILSCFQDDTYRPKLENWVIPTMFLFHNPSYTDFFISSEWILHTDDIRAVRCGAGSCVELSALPQDSMTQPVYAASEKRPSPIVVCGCVGLAAAWKIRAGFCRNGHVWFRCIFSFVSTRPSYWPEV